MWFEHFMEAGVSPAFLEIWISITLDLSFGSQDSCLS